ncbi:hypothetical protein IMW75_03325 [Pseudomonas gregormendelii]|uniref:Uncharacterized protein n=1 Tax=Pseudomonas gregormendelii TaxID=1628277 RepID=A0ABS3ABV2_9PSED|nr:hypothetical protein [Pseudomonas gregormendelii]MBN3964316.1 hypothetical protein [Pseudomonas gregormendelii]
MKLYKDALNSLVAGEYSQADDGDSFMKIAITLAGRQYVAQLNATA